MVNEYKSQDTKMSKMKKAGLIALIGTEIIISALAVNYGCEEEYKNYIAKEVKMNELAKQVDIAEPYILVIK